MARKEVQSARCSACGRTIDLRKTFRIERQGSLWCPACYLKHDLEGRLLETTRRPAEVILAGARPFDYRAFHSAWQPLPIDEPVKELATSSTESWPVAAGSATDGTWE
jgi:hypothetical protein